MANKPNDIRLLKKKKKRKRLIKKLLIVILIFSIIATGYITREKWLPIFDGIVYKLSNVVSTDDYKKNFPIKISTGADNKISTFSDRIALLSDTNLYIYKRDGEIQRSFQHTMSDPITKIVGDKVLIYDHAGSKLFVEGRSDRAFSKNLDKKILFANISRDGSICVVTQSDTAASDLTIYNNKGEKILFSSFKEKIVDVSFSYNSLGCVVSTISAKAGEIVTKQYSVDFSKSEEVWSSNTTQTLPLMTSMSDKNQISVIGDEEFFCLLEDGSKLFSYVYTEKIDAWDTKNGISAVVLSDINKRSQDLYIISTENKLSTLEIQGEYKKVKIIDDMIYLLTKTSLDVYDENGQKQDSFLIEENYTDFCVIENYAYLMGTQEIDIKELVIE